MSAAPLPPGLASDREEARRLRDSAILHKRAQDSHRKRARMQRQRLAALEAKWERFGVQLLENDDSPSLRRPSERSDQAQEGT